MASDRGRGHEDPGARLPEAVPCRDLTSLNASRLILDSVGPSFLSTLTNALLDLLATSVAVYEKNGDYAAGFCASEWCRFATWASRQACGPVDDPLALASGKWLCHESCWNDAGRPSIETGTPVDAACRGGIRVYAHPIRAGDEIVGSICFGYGAPPRDPEMLRALAASLGVGVEEVQQKAAGCESRPPLVVELGKKSLHYAARLIGEIVERRRAEEALRQTTEMVRALFQASPVAITMIDTASRVTLWNPAAERMFGWSESEVLGKTLPITPPGGEEEHAGLRERAMRGEAVTAADVRRMRKDGTLIDVELSSAPIRDANGAVCGIVGIHMDVTRRKRAETVLRESEQRFRTLAEAAFEGIALSENGVVLDVNEQLAEMLGWKRHEVVGRSVLEFIAPEHRDAVADSFRTFRAGPHEEVLLRRNGGKVPAEVRVRELADGDRHLRVTAIRDLSDRRKAEEERRRLEDRMREVQKLESLGVLAGGIAHDFNNLLLVILGNADLALHRLDPSAPARSNVEEIEGASKRAADLCRQMLAYSGRGIFDVGRCDLSEVVRDMAGMLEISISKMATLRYALAQDLPPVQVDVTQIRQVVVNLVTNASEALGGGGGTISVSTGVKACDRACLSESFLDDDLPGGQYVFLEVSDTGHGIDEETRRRIFDPFYTTKFTGRGLGLAVVLGIVRGHKGAIRVSSEPGRGTTFRILLPAAAGDKVVRQFAAEQDTASYGGGAVLLVDDDSCVRGVGSGMLEMLGFKVLTASNGREALEIFAKRADEIVLVVLDLTMPEMSGEEAFRAIRRLRSGMRVILSSGYDEQDVVRRFAGKGLTGFLQKPYSLGALRETLDRIFG